MSENLRSALACHMHDVWVQWMKHLRSKLKLGGGRLSNEGEGLVQGWLPSALAQRWFRQMSTAYAELPPSEQASDLHQAELILDVLVGVTRKYGIDELLGAMADNAWKRGDKGFADRMHDYRRKLEKGS